MQVRDIDMLPTQFHLVLNSQFEYVYEFYMEKNVMDKLSLGYPATTMMKGCVATMTVRRRIDFSKAIMKQAWDTHEMKILNTRNNQDIKIERIRATK